MSSKSTNQIIRKNELEKLKKEANYLFKSEYIDV